MVSLLKPIKFVYFLAANLLFLWHEWMLLIATWERLLANSMNNRCGRHIYVFQIREVMFLKALQWIHTHTHTHTHTHIYNVRALYVYETCAEMLITRSNKQYCISDLWNFQRCLERNFFSLVNWYLNEVWLSFFLPRLSSVAPKFWWFWCWLTAPQIYVQPFFFQC